MFDAFQIFSGDLSLPAGDETAWISDVAQGTGTSVRMRLHNHTARTVKVIDQFTSGDGHGFNTTVVPVALAQYGDDKLVSRSQAKRVVARLDLFEAVVFDFARVATIGQAFADEIFRVFARDHPNIEVTSLHANVEVARMIDRAKAGGAAGRAVSGTCST